MKWVGAAIISFNIISMACAAEIVDSTAPTKSPNPAQSHAPKCLPPAEDTLPDNTNGRLVKIHSTGVRGCIESIPQPAS